MNRRLGVSKIVVFLFLALAQASVGSIAQAQETSQRKRIGIAPRMYVHHCFPVEVSGLTNGARQPDAILSELSIKIHAPKPVTAVRFGWYIFDVQTADRNWRAGCSEKPMVEKPILSGKTQLVDLGLIAQNSTAYISVPPRLIAWPADILISIDSPLITMKDLAPLSVDGTRAGLKDEYGMYVVVCEVHYGDGTKWEAEGEPPFMKQTK